MAFVPGRHQCLAVNRILQRLETLFNDAVDILQWLSWSVASIASAVWRPVQWSSRNLAVAQMVCCIRCISCLTDGLFNVAVDILQCPRWSVASVASAVWRPVQWSSRYFAVAPIVRPLHHLHQLFGGLFMCMQWLCMPLRLHAWRHYARPPVTIDTSSAD